MTQTSDRSSRQTLQPSRVRKLIGLFVLVPLLIIYLLIAMAIGAEFINSRGFFVELIFYVVAGLAWIPAAAVIIRWMQRPVPAASD